MERTNGILLIDKPRGWTSFDVVNKVRSTLRTVVRDQLSVASAAEQITDNREQRTLLPKVKVGHTGTLDPLATGLLVLLLGNYTKRAPELTKLDKTYDITMKLGETSTTGDEEGEKTPVSNKKPVQSDVEQALRQSVGDIMQTPPKFSAMKVNGQRAYKLAREGKEVKLEPRPVKIYHIQLTDYDYPFVKFTAEVSSGTYIRSLVEDIGKVLETGAYMSDLRRTKVGEFNIKEAREVTDKDLLSYTNDGNIGNNYLR